MYLAGHGIKLARTSLTYKRFYTGAQGESGAELGVGNELPGRNRFLSGRNHDSSLPTPSSTFAAQNCAGARAHLDRTGAWPASGGHTGEAGHYCRERMWPPGGGRGSKGSFVLQRSLSRWRTMRSTTRGSVIKETICMRAPQAQTTGLTSKIFLSNSCYSWLAFSIV